VPDLQKLLGRFPVQIGLGEADVDAVIRMTVLRKKAGADETAKYPLMALATTRTSPVSVNLDGVAHDIEQHLGDSTSSE
jgi:hypothetical protein